METGLTSYGSSSSLLIQLLYGVEKVDKVLLIMISGSCRRISLDLHLTAYCTCLFLCLFLVLTLDRSSIMATVAPPYGWTDEDAHLDLNLYWTDAPGANRAAFLGYGISDVMPIWTPYPHQGVGLCSSSVG